MSEMEWQALTLSLGVAMRSVTFSLPVAILVAWLLTRVRFPGRALLDAFVHLPLVSMTTKKAYGRDFIDEFLPEARAYLKMLGERPHAQKVNADRKAASDAYAAAKAAKK